MIVLAVVSSSCAADNTTEGVSADAVAAYLMSAQADAGFRQADLVTECARANGLDYIELGVDMSALDVDPAPGLTGRERIEAIGSGLLAISKLREDAFSEPPPEVYESEFDPVTDMILDAGPIVLPETGEPYQAGCRFWAYETANELADTATFVTLLQAYGEWMNEYYEGSPKFIEVQDRQFQCVADGGYPQIRSPEQLTEYQLGLNADWQEGRQSYEAALRIDTALALVYFDCYESVAADFTGLADEAARGFAESRDLPVGD